MSDLREELVKRVKELGGKYADELTEHDFDDADQRSLIGELSEINDKIAKTIEVILSLDWEKDEMTAEEKEGKGTPTDGKKVK